VLRDVVRGLPAGLPAAVFVVVHLPSGATSALPEVLSRAGPLLATHARNGEPCHPGHIYVAPPDHHLTLEDGVMRVARGPRENRSRPAIDPLFRSAARVYGRRVIGVILTGGMYDGVAGLMAVRAAGGVAVVQDPADSFIGSLPRTAAQIAGADHVVKAADLAGLLTELVGRPSRSEKGGTNMPDPLEKMPETVDRDMRAQEEGKRRGQVAVFTCPECGGSLWQVDEKELTRFRCHVGHAYVAEALLEEQSENLEAALWTAVRTFREKCVLSRLLARERREVGDTIGAERFEDDARVADRYGEVIRQYLLPDANGSPEEPEKED